MIPPLSAREAQARRDQQARATAGDTSVRCKDLFADTLTALLQCADQALEECGRPVGRAHLAPGQQVAWDECCADGGQLWVRLINVFPSGRPFPAQDSAQPCGITLLAAQIGIGVVRCAHTIDNNGNAPTPAELTSDTLDMTADASILLSAIQCCPALPDQTRIGTWTPQGPQGGCVGGEWQFSVGVGGCGCG